MPDSDAYNHALIRVLMIDDERFNHIVVKKILRHENMTLTSCTRSIDGITLLDKEDFDIILLDIVMPELNGVECLHKIREKKPTLPVIFLSSIVDDIDNSLLNIVADDIYVHYVNKNKIQTNLIKRIYIATDMKLRAAQQQRMHAELENDAILAGQIQRLMLPQWIVYQDTYFVSALYRPYGHASGDFYDLRTLPDGRVLFVIGDISGHGMQAALYTSSMLSFFKTDFFFQQGFEPHTILNLMNTYFCKINSSDSYLTCLIAIFDFKEETLTYQNAGHPDFIHLHKDEQGQNTCTRYNELSGAIPVGLNAAYEYLPEDTHTIAVKTNEPIFFITDGLTDIELTNGTSVDLREIDELCASYDINEINAMYPFLLAKNLKAMGYTVSRDDISVVMVVKSKTNSLIFRETCNNAISAITELSARAYKWCEAHGTSADLAAKAELLLLEFLQNEVLHSRSMRADNELKSFVRIKVSDDCQSLNIRIIDRSHWTTFEENFSAAREALSHPETNGFEERGRGLKIILTITDTIRRITFENVHMTEFVLSEKSNSDSGSATLTF